MQSLVFYDKNGNNINLNWDVNKNRYYGNLFFDENSSDTFKTICLYCFEKINSTDIEFPNNVLLEKFQLFNENGFDLKSGGITSIIKKIETINNDSRYFTKWVYGDNFDVIYPIGSEIIFNQSFSEFVNKNYTYTVLKTKKDAILIITNINNKDYNDQYSQSLDFFNDKSISSLNTICIKEYKKDDIHQISEWSEKEFFKKIENDKKISIINSELNDSVITVENKSLVDKKFKQFFIPYTSFNNKDLICKFEFNLDNELLYNGNIQIQTKKILLFKKIKKTFLKGSKIDIISTSSSISNLKLKDVDDFIIYNMVSYKVGDQFLYNGNCFECIKDYTQSSNNLITPENTEYWSDELSFILLSESASEGLLLNSKIYLISNKLEIIEKKNINSKVTSSKFFNKYSDFLLRSNIQTLIKDDGLYFKSLISGNYCNIEILADEEVKTIKNDLYDYIFSCKENIKTENNKNISIPFNNKIIFEEISDFGIKLKINDHIYYGNKITSYNNISLSNNDDIIKYTLLDFIINNRSELLLRGIIIEEYKSELSSEIDGFSLSTEFPNVKVDYTFETNNTHLIIDTKIEFLEINNKLNININNKDFYINYIDSISDTLNNWIITYKDYLINEDIYLKRVNNSFNVKRS